MSITAAVEGYSSSPNVSKSPADIATFEKCACHFCNTKQQCAILDITGKVYGHLTICQQCMSSAFEQEDLEWCDVEVEKCDFCKKQRTCLSFGLDGHQYVTIGDLSICQLCADKMFTEEISNQR